MNEPRLTVSSSRFECTVIKMSNALFTKQELDHLNTWTSEDNGLDYLEDVEESVAHISAYFQWLQKRYDSAEIPIRSLLHMFFHVD